MTMLRDEFLAAIEQVARAVQQSKARDLYRLGLRTQPELLPGSAMHTLLAGFADYSAAARGFSPHALRVVAALGLAKLSDAAFWVQAITGSREQRIAAGIVDILRNIDALLGPVARTAKLLQARPDDGTNALPLHGPAQSAVATLRLLLPESEGVHSPPARIVALLDGVQKMYDGMAQLDGARGIDLAVVACDSGGDKMFELTGSPLLMRKVKALIEAAWDGIVLFREMPPDQRLKNVLATLPVFTLIESRARSGGIEREKAELLRRLISEGVTLFVRAGALVPDLERRMGVDPRALAGDRAERLEAPPAAAKPQSGPDDDLIDPEFLTLTHPPHVSATPDDTAAAMAKLKRLIEGDDPGY